MIPYANRILPEWGFHKASSRRGQAVGVGVGKESPLSLHMKEKLL